MKQLTTYFRVYAKFNGQSNFKPIDCSNGRQVTNLIYATLVPKENLGKLTETYKGIDPTFAKIEARSTETYETIKINY